MSLLYKACQFYVIPFQCYQYVYLNIAQQVIIIKRLILVIISIDYTFLCQGPRHDETPAVIKLSLLCWQTQHEFYQQLHLNIFDYFFVFPLSVLADHNTTCTFASSIDSDGHHPREQVAVRKKHSRQARDS